MTYGVVSQNQQANGPTAETHASAGAARMPASGVRNLHRKRRVLLDQMPVVRTARPAQAFGGARVTGMGCRACRRAPAQEIEAEVTHLSRGIYERAKFGARVLAGDRRPNAISRGHRQGARAGACGTRRNRTIAAGTAIQNNCPIRTIAGAIAKHDSDANGCRQRARFLASAP